MNEDEEQAREIAHANEILNAVRHAIAAEREACARIAATHIPGRARGVTMPFGIAAAVKEAAHPPALLIPGGKHR